MHRTRRNRNLRILVILLIGISLSIANFHYINVTKLTSNQQLVEQAVQETKTKINKELQKVSLAITSLQLLFETADSVTRPVFDAFTLPFLKNLPGIKALEWAPRILDADREQYNQKLKNEGFEEHDILAANFEKKSLDVSPQKAFYYPVQYIAPKTLNKLVIGYDLSSDPKRYAIIKNSLESNAISVSPPLQLVQNKANTYSFLVAKSVTTPQNIQGILLGVYYMEDFIHTILKSELQVLDISIYDSLWNITPMFNNSHTKLNTDTPCDSLDVTLCGRVWKLYCNPNIAMTRYPHLPISYACLFLGFLITFLLIVMVYMNANGELHLAKKVASRTYKLNEANKEQAVLLKEIHHRVKNNLQVITSLLSLQSSNIDNPKIKEIFSVSQYRINTMAILHEELYQSENLSTISYGEYLQKLVDYLIQSILGSNHQLEVSIDVPQTLKLNIDTAIPLGLLINEIITNALKYGLNQHQKGTVYISIIPQKYPTFKLLIGDNGKGFSDEINYKTTKSLGLKLIRQLVRQLSGTIEKSDAGSGTHYIILFKEII
ncbi:CHASE domain-containing protein [Aureispira sp. CCB-E]|uniref:CHASE domain-containing protein n=1 Tax=Aureispira sp. CCB-E TaxID=3051121 RepID=UPI002868C16C|nr:CHASE domain-containing protein [Aureispira sp. CCB-E]WMX16823.1 CHASE domain-containing protein [Aureispira sp. CCB-E]